MKKPREIIIEKWCVRSGIPNILKIVNSAVQALNPLNNKTAVAEGLCPWGLTWITWRQE